MRIVFLKEPLRRALRWMQRALFACALLLLGYCAFVLVDSWVFQYRESRQLERLLLEQPRANAQTLQTTAAVSTSRPAPVAPVKPGGLIGRIEIERLGLSAMVMEGISRTTLRRAVGHIPGTALPGEPGNSGISGHRDTFFRPLRNIRESDIITLTTPLAEYRYRVVATAVVRPNDVSVLEANGIETLTLVTCYPFYFVGPAPGRFIVRAVRLI